MPSSRWNNIWCHPQACHPLSICTKKQKNGSICDEMVEIDAICSKSRCVFFSKWLSKWHHRWNDGQQMCYRGSCSIHIRNVFASQIQRLRIRKNAAMLIALCQTDKWGETHLRARIDQMLSCAFRNLGVHALFDYAIRDGLRVGPSPKRRVINTCDNNTAVSICKLVARRGRWPLQKKKERNKRRSSCRSAALRVWPVCVSFVE